MNKQAEKHTAEKPVGVTDDKHVAISLVEDHNVNNGPVVATYAINPADQNTVKNPRKETTVTLPHLVRKVPQKDLLPRPFTSFNQVLLLSYISTIFCLFSGLLANQWAWRAKLRNGKGFYTLAERWGRRAVYASYVSIVMGTIIAVSISLSLSLNSNAD